MDGIFITNTVIKISIDWKIKMLNCLWCEGEYKKITGGFIPRHKNWASIDHSNQEKVYIKVKRWPHYLKKKKKLKDDHFANVNTRNWAPYFDLENEVAINTLFKKKSNQKIKENLLDFSNNYTRHIVFYPWKEIKKKYLLLLSIRTWCFQPHQIYAIGNTINKRKGRMKVWYLCDVVLYEIHWLDNWMAGTWEILGQTFWSLLRHRSSSKVEL